MIRVLILSPFTYYGKYLLTGESLYYNPEDEKHLKELSDLCCLNSEYRPYLAIFDESGKYQKLIESFTNPIGEYLEGNSIEGVNYVEEIQKNTSAKVDEVQRIENYLAPPQEAKENYYIAQTLSSIGVVVDNEVESETSPNTMFLDAEDSVAQTKVESTNETEKQIEEIKNELSEVVEVLEKQETKYTAEQLKELPYLEVKEIAESMKLEYTTKVDTITAILNKQDK